MDTRPTLKRPKRKLCFPTKIDSVPRKFTESLTLGDVDKMFDDMDSIAPEEKSLSTSSDSRSVIQHSVETSPVQQVFAGDGPLAPLHATKTPVPLVADSEMVIKLPGPVKTSSPIEKVEVVGGVEKYSCKDVSPILLKPDVEATDDAELEPLSTRIPNLDELHSMSPPNMLSLKRSAPSAHKKIVDDPGKESQPVNEETPSKVLKIVLEDCQRTSEKQVPSDEPVEAEIQRPEPTHKQSSSDQSQSGGETATRLGKDVSAFLQKVRDAGQNRLAGKLQTPVQAAPPPPPPPPSSEFEDDFMILEEEAPLWFAIPTKSIAPAKKREKLSQPSSSDSSTDKGAKDRPQETAPEEKELENPNAEHRVDPADLMTKVDEGRKKDDAKAWSDNELDELAVPEDPPAGDKVEHVKPVKKKQKMKNISAKVSNKAKEEPKDATKADNKIVSTETNTVKSSIQTEEAMQGPEDIQETETEMEVKSQKIKKQTKQERALALSDSSSVEENIVLGKRKRKPVGQWWMSCSQSSDETCNPPNQFTPKKLKEQPEEAGPSGAQTKTEDKVVKKGNRKWFTASASRNKGKEKKKRQNPSHDSGDPVSHKANRNTPSKKTAKPSASAPATLPQDDVLAADWREPIGTTSDGWTENTSPSDALEWAQEQPQPLEEPKSLKDRRKQPEQKQQQRRHGRGRPRNVLTSPPKTVKRTLAVFNDVFSQSGSESPKGGKGSSSKDAGSRPGADAGQLHVSVIDQVALDHSRDAHNKEAEVRGARDVPDCRSQLENTAKGLMSGPSSMLEVREDENSCDLILPSPSATAALTALDLCGPPLKPLNLQPKDKNSLREWFSSLWSSSDNEETEVSPDHFKWFYHQGRVCGLQVDLNRGSICNGKMLLGSYMKKPLWVDHSAITVFNMLTSSVDVIVNGRKSHYKPGQAFMVQCGHAYSISNTTAQPAVLYFTRILSESSE